jgi:hypothetical protein
MPGGQELALHSQRHNKGVGKGMVRSWRDLGELNGWRSVIESPGKKRLEVWRRALTSTSAARGDMESLSLGMFDGPT